MQKSVAQIPDLAVNNVCSGVEDSGVVYNLNVTRLQLYGDVELRALNQLCNCPARDSGIHALPHESLSFEYVLLRYSACSDSATL